MSRQVRVAFTAIAIGSGPAAFAGESELRAVRDLMQRTSALVPSVEGRFELIQNRHRVHIVLDGEGRYLYERRSPRPDGGGGEMPLSQAVMSDGDRLWEYVPQRGGYSEVASESGRLPRWEWLYTPWPLLGRVAELVQQDPAARAGTTADGGMEVELAAQGLLLRFNRDGRLSFIRSMPRPPAENGSRTTEVEFEQYERISAAGDAAVWLPTVISQRITMEPGEAPAVITLRAARWSVGVPAEEVSRLVRFDAAVYGQPAPLGPAKPPSGPPAHRGGELPQRPAPSASDPLTRSPWFWLAACLGLVGVWGALRWWRR